MIFADTSALAAAFAPNEAEHLRAREWMARERRHLVTTNYVIDELLTFLRARRATQLAVEVGRQLLNDEIAEIVWVTPEIHAAAWDVFRRFDDKEWSFTDCTSKVIMERLGITIAFTLDHHFQQFGNVQVVPD